MSTIKVDTVRPVTADASLTLQGDSSGSGVTGLTIDSSGVVNTTTAKVTNIQATSGQSLTIKDEDGNAAITIGTDNTATGYLNLNFGSYNGGSGTLSGNTLEDYEEGTFLPTLTASTSGTITVDSSDSNCWYVKIGRVVHFGGRIDTIEVSSPTGDLSLGNFPFASATVTNGQNQISFSISFTGLGSGLNGAVSFLWLEGTTSCRLRDNANNTGTGASMADHIDASTQIYINGSYLTS